MDAQRRIGQYREAPGSDIVKQGLLKKLKTMKKKYFILRSTSSSGPSRLDYYDKYVWQGSIKKKSKTSCTRIEGPYRLCLSNKEVSLVELDKFHPSYVFQFSSIRRCGHSDNFFFMEVGRTAVTGSGELWMLVEDTQTSLYMHNRILESPRRARAPINRPQSTVVYSRSSHPNLDHIPSGGSSPSLEDYDDPSSSNDDYLPMSPGQASPVQRSRSRSPTPPVKTLEMKQASAGSEGQDSTGKGDWYMDMKPGSGVSSPGNDSYMSRTPPPSGHAPPDKSGYVSMAPPVTAAGSGYIDMTPGQRIRKWLLE
ncbi:IRS1B-like protein [Mya arenaria]|uniref:IRS1B-like protein n=1 Tax=Mya arenaria TaxID=6604 RepID=A0ABY7F2Q8_MYAAR|nr:IRS1B-like protein [Mya arenaria]